MQGVLSVVDVKLWHDWMLRYIYALYSNTFGLLFWFTMAQANPISFPNSKGGL